MFYIVGLGNPGSEYVGTRHNVGWQMLDALATHAHLPRAVQSSKYSGRISEGVLNGEEVVLLYPDTFMNKSGKAVVKLVPRDCVARLIVICDDVDLPVGEVKVSVGKGAGGHNGVASIINSLGSKDFVRIRVGIAKSGFWPFTSRHANRPRGGVAMTKHVLGRFSSREQRTIDEEVTPIVLRAIELIIEKGTDVAMNEINSSR